MVKTLEEFLKMLNIWLMKSKKMRFLKKKMSTI